MENEKILTCSFIRKLTIADAEALHSGQNVEVKLDNGSITKGVIVGTEYALNEPYLLSYIIVDNVKINVFDIQEIKFI